MVTGKERFLTLGNGRSIRVMDAHTVTGFHRIPLLRAAHGFGNVMTLAQILAADASLNNVRVPLASGGSFVTVAQIRDFV
jgi:hypothetical protein